MGDFTLVVWARLCNALPWPEPLHPKQSAPTMDPTLVLATTLSLSLSSGQMAGQRNVILSPKETVGLKIDVGLSSVKALEMQVQAQAVAGKVTSSDANRKSGIQEFHTQTYAVYNFHTDDSSRAGVGLYADLALPTHNHTPPHVSLPDGQYADEESEISHRQALLGLDLKLSAASDHMRTDLHNILFFSGNRVAPNLVTYKPMLGFKWHNAYLFTGDKATGGLSLITDVDFYFARKSGVSALNAHDGLGGTKREILLSYGFRYEFSPASALSLQSYGYNNLNRGNSATTPTQFRDGFRLTYEMKL